MIQFWALRICPVDPSCILNIQYGLKKIDLMSETKDGSIGQIYLSIYLSKKTSSLIWSSYEGIEIIKWILYGPDHYQFQPAPKVSVSDILRL